MNNRTAAHHQSEAITAFMSGALTNPHQPGEPTADRARKVLPWLERETNYPITWEINTDHPRVTKFFGRITQPDPTARRTAIQAWADVIGSWSITDDDGVLAAIGMYQGFPVELTATP